MANSRYDEKYVKKDPWVKDLFKLYNPETLASLIERRLRFPATTGPFITGSEKSLDIIVAYIAADPRNFGNKIEPAIGLLLYKSLKKELIIPNDMLRQLFSVIRQAKFVNCFVLVKQWLNDNAQYLVSNEFDLRATMYDALIAFGRIQDKEQYLEEYWLNIWREGQEYFWPAAFYGLRIQNSELACKELSLLISRHLEKKLPTARPLIMAMWGDITSRTKMKTFILNGLNEDNNWAGLVLNILLDTMNETQQAYVLSALKE